MNRLIEKHCFLWNNKTFQPVNYPVPVCHLTSGLYQNEVFQVDGNSYICSRHNEIFLYILKYLHCSLAFVNSNINYGGRLQPNGSWNGILALFAANRADFVPHVFSNNKKRDTIIYYQTLIPGKDHLSIVSYPKAVANDSAWSLLSRFSWQIWLLVVLFYLLYSSLNWCNLLLQSPSRHCTLSSAGSSFIAVLGLLLGQGTVHLTSNPARVLHNPLILWIAFAFVFRTLFSNDITAILLSSGQFRYDTFQQLFRLPAHMKLLIVEKSSGYYFLEEKFPGLMGKVERIAYEENNSVDTLRRVAAGSCVLISPREFAEMIQSYYSAFAFHVSKEGFYSTLGNFAISHSLDWRNKARLSRLWQSIYEFGLEVKLDKTIFMNNLQASFKKNLSTLAQLSADDVSDGSSKERTSSARPLLTIYLIGISAAVLLFLLEQALHLGNRMHLQ